MIRPTIRSCSSIVKWTSNSGHNSSSSRDTCWSRLTRTDLHIRCSFEAKSRCNEISLSPCTSCDFVVWSSVTIDDIDVESEVRLLCRRDNSCSSCPPHHHHHKCQILQQNSYIQCSVPFYEIIMQDSTKRTQLIIVP